MRCLLIGSGGIGQRHARALRALARDVEIVALRSGHGGPLPNGVVDREIVSRDQALTLKPDCVIVANPASRHAESAAPFIAAGIPVLLEKPVTIDAVSADTLRNAARDNTRVLVAHVLRHDPALAKFRDVLKQGAIGRLVTLHLEAGQALANWRPRQDVMRSISARAETGGGVMFELSHEVDSARWLLGEVETVCALAATCGEPRIEVEDAALISLRSASGAIALVQIDMARGAALRRYRAIGTEGTLTWSSEEGSVHLEKIGEARVISVTPLARDDLFLRQMEHFLAVMRGEASPLCSLEDGVRTLSVVLDARRKAGLDVAA